MSVHDQFRDISNSVTNKHAACLMSALYLHGLTTLRITAPEIMVDQSTVLSRGDIEFFRPRNPKWDIGIINYKGYWVTNIERTIAECLFYRDKADYHGIYAMKRAIKEKKTTSLKVIKMARELGYYEKLEQFFDAFLTEGKE